jgi:hypothetical protein
LKSGSLTVVGTGYNIAGQVTPESLSCMQAAERFFYLVSDPATSAWLKSLNTHAESLHDCYRVGEPGIEGCERMVERILNAVRQGFATCAAFYGHPAIFVPPGLESVRRAREEGYAARMLPAISFEDCLFADLGVDPGVSGRLMYEATDFLIRPRKFHPASSGSHCALRFRAGRPAEPERPARACRDAHAALPRRSPRCDLSNPPDGDLRSVDSLGIAGRPARLAAVDRFNTLRASPVPPSDRSRDPDAPAGDGGEIATRRANAAIERVTILM